MCSLNYPLADAARRLADAEFDLQQLICDAQGAEREYALSMLEARRDERAAELFRLHCRMVDQAAEEKAAPLGLGALP